MRITRRRLAAALAAPAVALLVLAGCAGGGGGSAQEGGDHAKLTLGMTADINGWQPLNQPTYQGWAMSAVYDTLLVCDVNGQPVASAAESWEYSDDNTAATLHLREGMTFSDGTALDADAVRAAFEDIKENSGQASDYEGVTYDIPDPLTITLTWPEPQPLLTTRLCQPLLASPDYLASGDLGSGPVGSGPYVYDASASTPGSIYSFTRNPDYWNPDAYPYEKLELRVIADETASVNALKTGQIQGTIITAGSYDEVEASGATIQTIPNSVTRLVIADHTGAVIPALGDVRVRQAMNMVFDKQAMADQLYLGHAKPYWQIFREGTDAYIPDLEDPYPFDVDKAQALMKEAGFEEGFDLTLPTMEGQNFETLLPYVTQQLALLNITVKEDRLTGPSAIGDLLSGDYPVPLWQLGTQADSIADIVPIVLPSGYWNVLHQPDATVEGLWQQILTGDDAARKTAQQEMNQYLIDQAWFAPMVQIEGFYASSPDIEVAQATDPQALHPLLADFK